MRILKNTYEAYHLKNNGEWATICLLDLTPNSPRASGEFAGELLIHSTYGSWAYNWNSCGRPFKEFLQDVDFSYLFKKFMGHDARCYAGSATVKELKRRIIYARTHSGLSKDESRFLWNQLVLNQETIEESVAGLVESLSAISDDSSRAIRDFLSEPWEYAVQMPAPATIGFWKELWPEFRAMLATETLKAAA